MPSALVSLVFALAAAPSVVAIEPPAEWQEEARAKVVESCSRALGEGRCVLVTGTQPAPPYVARLQWEASSLKVTLLGASAEVPLAESSLHFSDADDEKQRWVAAGLLVAALTVAEAQPSEGSSAPTEAAPPPPEPSPPVVAAAAPRETTSQGGADGRVSDEPPAAPSGSSVALQIDTGVFGGPGLNHGLPRFGATLRGWGTPRGSRLAWTIGARGARGAASYVDAEAIALWLGGSLGLGVCVAVCTPDGALRLAGEAVLERAELSVERADGVQRQAVWRYGGRLGLVGGVRLGQSWGLWASADATLLQPEIAVRVDSAPADQESSIRWTAGGGLRFYTEPVPDRR